MSCSSSGNGRRKRIRRGRQPHSGRARPRCALGSAAARAEGFIARFEQWLKDNQLLQSIEQLGFNEAEYPKIAGYAVRVYGDGKQLEALGALPAETIVALLCATKRQGSP